MRFLIFVFLMIASSTISAEWHTYKGVTVWTTYPSKERTFSWTGKTDSDGKADGDGVFILYLAGEKIATYTGMMSHGRMNGYVTAVYHKAGKKYEGNLEDWNENGYGTMIFPDGRRQTGRWKNGELVEVDHKEALGSSRSLAASEDQVSARSDSQENSTILILAPGIKSPGEQSSGTENFLYGLAAATESYFLYAAYMTGYSSSLDDAFWAKGRTAEVLRLVNSPLRDEIPPALLGFCKEALRLDAMLQVTARANDNATSSAKDDARDLLIDSVRNLPQLFSRGGDDDETFEGQLFGKAGRLWARAYAVDQMFRAFVQAKKAGAFHSRWGTLLERLAVEDPNLRPYTQDPRVTDPTWHFMRSSDAGDVFFGESFSNRGPKDYMLNRISRRKTYAGDLGKGPIEINFSKRGTFVYEISVSLPKDGDWPTFVCNCSRGHFALRGADTTWVARGLTDFLRHGRLDFDENKYWRDKATVTLMHFLTTGKGEDVEAVGSVLIYTRGQAHSDDEARRIAQRVNL